MLDAFGVSGADVLGCGGESVVLALDDGRVLRMLRQPQATETLARKCAFLADLDGRLPYATPRILEIAADGAYTVETRIPGMDMLQALATLKGAARATLWAHYVAAVEAISAIARSQDDYGQVLAPHPIRATDWRTFITLSMERATAINEATIIRDIGPPADVLAKARALVDHLPEQPPRVLVHGDAFPGNFMVDENGAITGLLDFGEYTVVGDAVLELAAAYTPLEQIEECDVADSRIVSELLIARHGAAIEPAFRCYRAWFALTQVDPANAAPPYPRLYGWCVDTLRALMRGQLVGLV
ncbi:MAG: phosphotransferase family protein [Alphaproteobacteria bacterium]